MKFGHERVGTARRTATVHTVPGTTADTTENVAGNTYDKYASTNPIEQRMMRGFFDALDAMLDGLSLIHI